MDIKGRKMIKDGRQEKRRRLNGDGTLLEGHKAHHTQDWLCMPPL